MFWTRTCVGCGVSSAIICEECIQKLQWITQADACRRCGSPFGRLVCCDCMHEWNMDCVICAQLYAGLGERIVTAYKDGGERVLSDVIALCMYQALEETMFVEDDSGDKVASLNYECDFDVLTYVPASPEAIVRRGFDHMELVTRKLSELLGIECVQGFMQNEKSDQRYLTRDERGENLQSSVVVQESFYNQKVLVIDDVITTGATIKNAVATLSASGAQKVCVLTFCKVW